MSSGYILNLKNEAQMNRDSTVHLQRLIPAAVQPVRSSMGAMQPFHSNSGFHRRVTLPWEILPLIFIKSTQWQTLKSRGSVKPCTLLRRTWDFTLLVMHKARPHGHPKSDGPSLWSRCLPPRTLRFTGSFLLLWEVNQIFLLHLHPHSVISQYLKLKTKSYIDGYIDG